MSGPLGILIWLVAGALAITAAVGIGIALDSAHDRLSAWWRVTSERRHYAALRRDRGRR